MSAFLKVPTNNGLGMVHSVRSDRALSADRLKDSMIANYAGPSDRRNDIRVMAIGLACAAVSVLLLLTHALGWTPLPVALPLVAVPAVIGLRCLLVWSSRSASASRRCQVSLILSWCGLVVSCGSLALALPSLTRTGGVGQFLGNVTLYAWTIVLFAAVIVATRTLGPRALAGAFFVGFFAVGGLATLLGKPIVSGLGEDSVLATAVLIPILEEILKALPVLLLLLVASRSRQMRPSLGDVTLFGFIVGAGLALYEDALYGRSSGDGVGGVPPFSLILPTLSQRHHDPAILISGHAVYTGTIALGLAIGILYRRRHRLAWLAIPICAAAAVLEHISLNGVASVDRPGWTNLTVVLTLGGYICTLLLCFGLLLFTWMEWRAVKKAGHVGEPSAGPRGLLLPMATGRMLRSRALARLQLAAPTTAVTATPVATTIPSAGMPPPPPTSPPVGAA